MAPRCDHTDKNPKDSSGAQKTTNCDCMVWRCSRNPNERPLNFETLGMNSCDSMSGVNIQGTYPDVVKYSPRYGRKRWKLTWFLKGEPYDRMVHEASKQVTTCSIKFPRSDHLMWRNLTWSNETLEWSIQVLQRCQKFQGVTEGFNKTLENMTPSIHDHTKRRTRDYTIACMRSHYLEQSHEEKMKPYDRMLES